MKTITKTSILALAAASAVAIAAPAAAQPSMGDHRGPQPRGDMNAPWNGPRENLEQLQNRFDAGVQSGSISRRETIALRSEMSQLSRLLDQYRRGGLDGWERSDLQNRSRNLGIHISEAIRMGADGGGGHGHRG